MSGDLIACPLLDDRRIGPHRCRARQDPVTMAYKPAECGIGLGSRCPWPELRERRIKLEEQERNARQPIRSLVRMREAVGR